MMELCMPIMKIIFSKWYREEISNNPLHHFACANDVDSMHKAIEYLHKKSKSILNQELHTQYTTRGVFRGDIPICSALENRTFKGQYIITIMLLKAGTDPAFRAEDGHSFFYEIVGRGIRYLHLLRLALMFQPDYKTVRYPVHDKTIYDEVVEWNKKHPGILRVIEKTVEDSEVIISLKAQAAHYQKSNRFDMAARCFDQIAEIYSRQLKIEIKVARWLKAILHENNQDKANKIFTESLDSFDDSPEVSDLAEGLSHEDFLKFLKSELMQFYQSEAMHFRTEAIKFRKTAQRLNIQTECTDNPLCEAGTMPLLHASKISADSTKLTPSA